MSAIESTLVENRVFEPSAETVKAARIQGMEGYNALCAEAEADFEGFWGKRAKETLAWHKPFTKVLDESNKPSYKWFDDGEINASYNCLDRHMGTPVENKTAIIFEADDGAVTKVTYKELLAKVSQFANALKAQGVKKGDRIVTDARSELFPAGWLIGTIEQVEVDSTQFTQTALVRLAADLNRQQGVMAAFNIRKAERDSIAP